jgi:hypothetical protein
MLDPDSESTENSATKTVAFTIRPFCIDFGISIWNALPTHLPLGLYHQGERVTEVNGIAGQ